MVQAWTIYGRTLIVSPPPRTWSGMEKESTPVRRDALAMAKLIPFVGDFWDISVSEKVGISNGQGQSGLRIHHSRRHGARRTLGSTDKASIALLAEQY